MNNVDFQHFLTRSHPHTHFTVFWDLSERIQFWEETQPMQVCVCKITSSSCSQQSPKRLLQPRGLYSNIYSSTHFCDPAADLQNHHQTLQRWAFSLNKIDKYTNIPRIKRHLAVNKKHEYFFAAILQTIQKMLTTYLLRLTRCCHKSLNSASNKVEIYGKCFHRFASISGPASKLIID